MFLAFFTWHKVSQALPSRSVYRHSILRTVEEYSVVMDVPQFGFSTQFGFATHLGCFTLGSYEIMLLEAIVYKFSFFLVMYLGVELLDCMETLCFIVVSIMF